MKKWSLFFCLFLVPVCHSLYHTHLKRVQGFCVSKVLTWNHPKDPKWDVSNDLPMDAIHAQPYHYFGSGKTCYAFLSDDGKYVIKLLKQNRMRPFSLFEKCLGYPLCSSKRKKSKCRSEFRNRLYNSFVIAYRDFPEHTGVIYLHLNRTKNLNQRLHFIDHQGKPFTLNADDQEFIVQLRSERVFPKISEWMENGDDVKAKQAIDSICELVKLRCALGIHDDDNNCRKNFGLIGTQAIEIDVGEFSKDPAVTTQTAEQLNMATEDLAIFLDEHYPELHTYLRKHHGTV